MYFIIYVKLIFSPIGLKRRKKGGWKKKITDDKIILDKKINAYG